MAEHIVKILECSYISHDVKRFMVEKPAGPGRQQMCPLIILIGKTI